MVIKIDGHKRFGLPKDWEESMTIVELIEHFNLIGNDAKKISDTLSVIYNAAIDELEEEE